MKTARPADVSAFIDSGLAARWLQERIEKVENRLLTPEAAMRSLAAEINAQIRLNLERRPDLQRRYEQVTGRRYTADWCAATRPARPWRPPRRAPDPRRDRRSRKQGGFHTCAHGRIAGSLRQRPAGAGVR
jgi:hypothetical protein